MSPTPMTYHCNGLTLRGDSYGPEGGPGILLAHGGGQTRHSWHGAATHLAGRGWHAVSLDLRGHGDSDWSPSGAYELTDFAGDIREVAATFPKPPVLVGASLGGNASLAAIAHADDPSAVASALVLVDVSPYIEPAGVERIRSFMLGNPEGFADLAEVADAIAAYNPHRPRPTNLEGLKKNVRLHEDGRWHWHWDPLFMSRSPDETRLARNRDQLEAAARELTLPTLLVRGGASDLLSPNGVKRFRELVPHAETVDIPGAGHMVAGDRNDAFTAAIAEFLDRIVS